MCDGWPMLRVRDGVSSLLLWGLSTIAWPAWAQVASPAQTVLSFNPAAVGTTASGAQQLTATFSVSGYSGAFTPTASLRYGLHYAAGAVNCTAAGSGETCTVKVTFVPTLPGGRQDALFLMNGSTVLATALLYGVGQSPLGLIQPGIVTQPVAQNANYLYESAVDENGTVYVLGSNSNTVISVTRAGVVTTLPVTVTSPHGIAVDGTGTLYIGQNGYSHSIVTYSATAGMGAITVAPPTPYTPCSNSNSGSLEYLYTVAVDGLGDLFMTEILCQQIFELKPDGTYATTAISPAITQPSTMTADSAGNVYVGGYTINELTAGGVQTQINAVGASDGLAVDAAGTVYATRYAGAGGVAELPASNYGASLATLDPAASPLGASVGPDGTVFVGNYTNLDRVDRSQGAIAFGAQAANTTTSPQTVSLYNGGNEALTVSGVSVTGAGFAVQAAATNNCTSGAVVPPGALCNVAVTWTPPHAGTFSGTLSLASNSLNTAATLPVALSGFVYGVYVTASPDPVGFGTRAVGAMSSLPVSLTNSGDLYSAGIGTPSSDNPAFTVAPGTCTSSLAVGASCQLAVTFAPTATQAYSGTVTLMVSSSGGGPAQTVTFTVTGTGSDGVDASASDAGTEASNGGPDATIAPDASIPPGDASPDDAAAPFEADAVSDAGASSTGSDGGAAAPPGADAAAFDRDAFAGEAGPPYAIDYDAAHPGPRSGGGGWNCGVASGHGGDGGLPAVGLVALAFLGRRRRAKRIERQ